MKSNKEPNMRDNYFKQQFYGGRSGLARALDVIVLRVTVFAASYVFLVFYVRPAWLAFLLSALIAAMFSVAAHMVTKSRWDKFVKKSMNDLRGDFMIERLLMMPREQLRAVAEAYTLKLPNVIDLWEQDEDLLARREGGSFMLVGMLQSASEAGQDELLEFYRRALECSANGLLLYSTAAFSEDAESLAKRLSIPVSLFPPKKLIALAAEADLLPSDEETEQALDVIIAQKREPVSLRKAAFAGYARRYLVCALVLAAASVLTGYYAYYPILAAVCVSMGLMTWWLNRSGGSAARQEGQAVQN